MARQKKERPGVMIYFDFLDILQMLDLEQAGILLHSILEYAKDGKTPNFEDDGMLAIAWAAVRSKIDFDRKRYEETCLKNSYNAYVGKMQREGRDKEIIPFEEWRDGR